MVPEPAEIEDEDIALYERVPTHSNVPCRISVFLWSARIYSVVSHALQTLYAPIDTTGIETDEYEEAKAMMDLERDLLNLRETLPEHLSISDPIDLSAPTWSVRHRIILRNRYARIMLPRKGCSSFTLQVLSSTSSRSETCTASRFEAKSAEPR